MNFTQEPAAIQSFLVLLLIASATCVSVKWIKVPYPVALVVAGLVIGLVKLIPPIVMTPELVLLIFLPALLFEASWNLDLRILRRNWLSVTVLATLGVVVCMFAVAAVLSFGGDVSIKTALLFGAMVSATDPVSVIALFRQMGINKRLTMILEGESLFNDGTAVVLFQLVLAILMTNKPWTVYGTIAEFFLIVAGGAVLGAALGFLASSITKAFEDHLLEITLTVVTAYGAFLIADHLKVSPVIAVVTAGIVLGNVGSRTGMSVATRLAVNSFWEYAAFLVNSLLFLLIGLQVQIPLIIDNAHLIALGVGAVMIARILVVYGICPFVSTKELPIPLSWRHILFWGGLRGALVMALALSIPLRFPERDALINMTFGVVLFTLLVPGITMEPVARLLKLDKRDTKLSDYQTKRSLLLALHAEMNNLTEMRSSGQIGDKTFETLQQRLEKRIESTTSEMEALAIEPDKREEIELRSATLHLLQVRKATLIALTKEGLADAEQVDHLRLEIEEQTDKLMDSTITS
jgi:monovalent cation:H+ antiporter, CPA1 family